MNAPAYRHLFGPVPSRRLGRSLGVDLTPSKVCTEDCRFCQIGRTCPLTTERKEWIPTADVITELDRWFQSGEPADTITLSGYGEPTLHTGFGHILRYIRSNSACRTALLSNGTLFYLPEVRREALSADIIKITISAWDENSFSSIHRPAPGITFARLMEGAHALRQEYSGTLWVETMLLHGWNDLLEQVQSIARQVNSLHADAIHLNTTTRPIGDGTSLPPVPFSILQGYAKEFSPAAEIPLFTKTAYASPLGMSDEALYELLTRHPMTLEDLADWADVSIAQIESRLAPLLALKRLHITLSNGRHLIRPSSPSPSASSP